MSRNQVWAVMRGGDDQVPAEVIAVFGVRPPAALIEELGPGHHVAPCPFIDIGDGVDIRHTWSCRMAVRDGVVEPDQAPARLLGASMLHLQGAVDALDDAAGPVERVLVDDAAAELEAAVHGQAVVYVTAYATSSERAHELALTRAEEIAEEQRRHT